MQKLLQQKGTDTPLDEITTKYQQVCAKAVEATIRRAATKHDINELVDQGFYVVKENTTMQTDYSGVY